MNGTSERGVLRLSWADGQSVTATCDADGWRCPDSDVARILTTSYKPDGGPAVGVPWVRAFYRAAESLGAAVVTHPDVDEDERVGQSEAWDDLPIGKRYRPPVTKRLSSDDSQLTPEPPERKFSSTQFDIEDAGYSRKHGSPLSALRDLALAIPDKDLAEDGREEAPHITAKYGLHTDSPEGAIAAAAGFGSIPVTLGDISIFEGPEADVVKIDVLGDRLHELNALLADSLPHTDTHPTYQPHLTLAYVKPGLGKKYVGPSGLEGRQLILRHLVFSNREKERTLIDLEARPTPQQQFDDDPGPSLAKWYAGWFTALEESGLEVSEDDITAAEDELDGTGWAVGRDDDGEWEARATRATGKKSWRWAHLTKAAQRAPAGYNRANPFHFGGKDYVGGQFIPGKAIEQASPKDREKLHAAKEAEAKKAEASKAARSATDVDVDALAQRLARHHGATELSKAERGNAGRAYAALRRHHGDLTLHRISELADRAEQAWKAVDDSDSNAEGLRSFWTRQLAAMHGWVERARGEGLKGEAVAKPADSQVDEVVEEPVAGVAAPEDGLGGHSREEAEAKAREYWDSRKESRGQGQPRPPADQTQQPDRTASEETENRVRARNIINGGEFGPNGEFYPAGTFFNLTEQGKQKPLPAGAGVAAPPDAGTEQDDGAGSGMPGAASQEALREMAREKAERAKYRAEMLAFQASPLGRMMGWREGRNDATPVLESMSDVFLHPWRDFAQTVGNDALRQIHDLLLPTLDDASVRQMQHRTDSMYGLPKKHHKDFPDSEKAYLVLTQALRQAETLDEVKTIGRLLSDLHPPVETPMTDEEADAIREQASGARMYPNKFAGRTDSGEKVPAGAGFVRKRPDGTYETLSMAQARAAMGPTAPTPPDPHFTGTLTDSTGRTYHFVDGKRVAGQSADPITNRIDSQPEEADTTPVATTQETPPVTTQNVADTVMDAARQSQTGRFGDNKVFINHVWDAIKSKPGLPFSTLAEFKDWLVQANRTGAVELSRADLVQAMNPGDVKESETRHPLGAIFNFIHIPSENDIRSRELEAAARQRLAEKQRRTP